MPGTHSKSSSLTPVVDVEVAETDTSFLTFKALDTYLESVFFCYSYNM